MTDRERFLATMRYEARDRCPIVDFGFWPETIVGWHEQGLPKEVRYDHYDATFTNPFFGMDTYEGGGPGVSVGLDPCFEWIVLEDRGDQEVVQQSDGVRVLRDKWMGSIPEHLGHLLVDRESWEKHYKPRLDPNHPGRVPSDYAQRVQETLAGPREQVWNVWGGSLYGSLRDWMGVENLSMVVYDEPELFEEMVETLGDCAVANLQRAIDAGAKFDAINFWEDMCYSGGPLLSPAHFQRVIVPQYRRIMETVAKGGCDLAWVDCDGKIDALVPLWLEAGVNIMFPIEVGTWNADPIAFRKEYGKDLRLMGGVGKRVLAGDPQGIIDEVRRLAPLVEEGGFIPMPDHRVPPDVPYENYLVYLREARRVWGGDTNLRPCPALESAGVR